MTPIYVASRGKKQTRGAEAVKVPQWQRRSLTIHVSPAGRQEAGWSNTKRTSELCLRFTLTQRKMTNEILKNRSLKGHLNSMSDVTTLRVLAFTSRPSWIRISLLNVPVFLPRNAMRKRGLCCCPVSVCLSVSLLSVCHVGRLYPDGLDIVILLVRPSSRIILVFLTPSAGTQFQLPRGTPLAGAQNTRGWEKLATFYCNRRLSRKLCEISQWLLCNVNKKL